MQSRTCARTRGAVQWKHWTQLEIDSLQRAEGVLHAAETFVGAHRRGGIGVFGRQG